MFTFSVEYVDMVCQKDLMGFRMHCLKIQPIVTGYLKLEKIETWNG